MRAKEFLFLSESEQLFEINMSPSSLRQLAAGIDARAGMEFEMIVPNVKGGDEDGELEPDYDQDERCLSIEDAVNFFHDGDYNGRNEVERLRERMRNDYWEWVQEKIDDDWENDGTDYIRDYINNNEWDQDEKIREHLEAMGLDQAAIDAAIEAGNKAPVYRKLSDLKAAREADKNYDNWVEADRAADNELDELVYDTWSQGSGVYDDARDQYREEKQDDYDDREWLDSAGISSMSDVESNYDITWPHWANVGGDGEASITDIADDFGQAIGRPWNASTNYHGARREAGKYVIEPDGSLEPDDTSDAGLEFVSPPLSISDMITDLEKVAKWAAKTGCYTNDSTGLHINVSIPDFSLDKLDYTKLALLLGDKYILEQFGRLGNTYAKSAFDMVTTRAQQRPEDVPAMLEKMRRGLATMAGKMIHSGTTSKYTSINTKEGYVEFRSPGGDWLGEYAADSGKIVNTLLRFVVALDAACDTEKYKEEYAKKLFQLLSGDNNKYNDSVKYFADYASGKIPKAALKSYVRQVQLQRQSKKQPSPASSSKDEKQYQVRDASGYSMLVTARNTNAAMQWARENYPDRFRNITDVVLYDNPVAGSTVNLQQQRAAGGFTGAWKIVDGSGRELYRFSGIGNRQADANRVAQQWLEQHRYTGAVDVLPIMG